MSDKIREQGSPLVCTKLLVLSRLLLKVLGQRAESDAALQAWGSKLTRLRQKLLRQLDKLLSRPGVEPQVVVEDLTAFCLATSSSPSDALAHFHKLRLRAIARTKQSIDESVQISIEARLELFNDTIRQSRTIFPDLLGSSLRLLGSRPLLEDGSIKDLEVLNLELHQRWFGEDIRNYTPWTRHDDLQRDAAGKRVQNWTAKALQLLAENVAKDLGGEHSAQNVVNIRQRVLQTWLSSRVSLRGTSGKHALQKLRQPFVARCQELSHVSSLDLEMSVKGLVIDQTRSWDPDDPVQPQSNMWDALDLITDLGEGGELFRNSVIAQRKGQTTEVKRVTDQFQHYAKEIVSMYASFKSMRDVRWDDDYDEEEDGEGSSSDEGRGNTNSTHDLLSLQDPDELINKLKDNVTNMAENFWTDLTRAFDSSLPAIDTSASPGIFLLRTLRTLRTHFSGLLANVDVRDSQRSSGQAILNKLEAPLARSTIDVAAASFSDSTNRLLSNPLHTRPLWEGTPPLPLQTSPAIFRFCRALVKHMESAGVDVWTPDAVRVLKRDTTRSIVGALQEVVGAQQQQHQEQVSEEGSNEKEGMMKEEKATRSQPEQKDEGQETDNEQEIGGSRKEAETDASDQKDSQETEGEKISDRNNISKPSFPTHDHFIQLLFDTFYLQQALLPLRAPPSSANVSNYTQEEATSIFKPLIQRLKEQVTPGIFDDEQVEARLQKNAREYWKRTYLLFGLLCNG